MTTGSLRRTFTASILVPLVAASVPLLGLSSCKTARKSVIKVAQSLNIVEHTSYKPPREAPELYRKGVVALEAQQYEAALDALEHFLRQEPASAWAQAATLNIGRAHEGLGHWSEASERYRSVVVATEKVAPKLQAMALYKLSFAHEAQGDDQKTVASLHDLLSRQKHLPVEIGKAELPARLAAAYARVGNFERAMDFYKKAEGGIAQLKRTNGDRSAKGELPEWLPRTLYFMGTMATDRASWRDFETSLRPLARGQSYLLQSAELGAEPWSDRSAKDLISTYRDLWAAIETAPKPESADPLVEIRAIQEKQWDRSALVLEHLQELRARAAPEQKDSSPQSKQIFQFAGELEKKIRKFLTQRPVGEGLTPEALQRKQSLRGKVVSPDSSLEKRFLEDARAQKTLPATQFIQDETEEMVVEDPNL